MSFVEMRLKAVRLGSSKVAVSYPCALDAWFDGLLEPWDESITPQKWVRVSAHAKTGQFEVVASTNENPTDSPALNAGDALAQLWERVSYLLMNDLCDAMALHAAVLCKDTFLYRTAWPNWFGQNTACVVVSRTRL